MVISKNKIITVIGFAFIVLLGFLREYLFVNINWIYKTLTEYRKNSAREEFYFLLEWSPESLNILKFCLTAIFIGLFFLLSWFIIKHHFKNKIYSKITFFAFGTLLFFSLLFQGLNFFIDSPNLYGIVRTLVGLLQSFVPFIFLFITFLFFNHSDENN